MLSDDKLFRLLKAILAQALNSPSALPGLILRTRHFMSIVKEGEKLRLEKEKQLQIPIPFLCIFSVTWRCNLNCIGCYAMNYTVKDELSLEKISDTIDECRKLGIYFFIIAGGEPLLVEGLLERIASLDKCFFLFYTNGILLNRHISTFKKARNIFPVISIEGEECSTDFRRGEGIDRQVKQAMRQLKDNGIPFGFSAMITHENLRDVTSREWIDRQWQLGARFGIFTDYIPFKKNLQQSFILTDEDRHYKDRILKYRNREARPPVFNLPPDEYFDGQCRAAGRGLIHINADGYVEPCPYSHFAADNIKEKTMQEILQSGFLKELRKLTESLDNPKKECMLFSHEKEVEKSAKKTGAFRTEN